MNYRQEILKKLIYSERLKFSELIVGGITTKHLTYYIKILIEENLISKDGSYYSLTSLGKNYVNRLDDESMQVEKLPKISVAITVRDVNESGNKIFLVNKKKKNPYFGKVGGFTGKLRFGESIMNGASRELLEETGLIADLEIRQFVRKLAWLDSEDNIVQDQIMILILATNPKGDFNPESKDHKSFWSTYDELIKRSDLYNTYLEVLKLTLNPVNDNIIELKVNAEGY